MRIYKRLALSASALVLAGGVLFAADAAAGQKVYAAKCASCHGKDGKGSATMAKMLKVDNVLLDLTDKDSMAKTDDNLVSVTSKGKDKMPAFEGKLKVDEMANSIAYIRSLGEPKK